MDSKKEKLVSSTPFVGRTNKLIHLFNDIRCSPIVPPQSGLPLDPQPTQVTSKQNEVKKTRVVKKRRIENKDKDVPTSATAGVLKELGVEAKDIGNNALSHSRNLYNMFPEPIILDSDEENSPITQKPMKKLKEDSKVIQSSTSKSNNEEKKSVNRVPGSSVTSRLTRRTAGRPKKQASIEPSNNVPGNSPNLRSSVRNKKGTSKAENHKISSINSILDDTSSDNDDANRFPVYRSITKRMENLRTNSKIKGKKARLSVDPDEMFPIEWSTRPKKPTDKENLEKKNGEEDESDGEKTNNNIQETTEVSNPVIISRFENVTFKPRRNEGGIVARCLKTDASDIGYLEVPANSVFSSERKDTTFVVIEGTVDIVHLGKQQTLSSGDMIHFTDGSTYEFRSGDAGHVRMVYITAL